MTAQRGTGRAQVEVHLGRKLRADPRHARERELRQRAIALGHQRQETLRLGPGPRSRAGLPGSRGRRSPGESSGAISAPGPGAVPPARRPGATGHSSSTQRRKPSKVETGASTSRRTQSSKPPTIASGVVSSPASASFSALCRAIVQARTTPMAVSEASAYATGGIAQMARSRHP